MTAVFLDTVGLLALWDTSDQWHTAAEQAFSRLQESRAALITTTYVLLEYRNTAARRPYRLAVDRLREQDRFSNLVCDTLNFTHRRTASAQT